MKADGCDEPRQYELRDGDGKQDTLGGVGEQSAGDAERTTESAAQEVNGPGIVLPIDGCARRVPDGGDP